MMKRVLQFAALTLALAILSTTSHAAEATGTTGVTLYEVSERVTFDQVQAAARSTCLLPFFTGYPSARSRAAS